MIFFDTETMGLMGPAVLIQWAEDDGPINLHNVWLSPFRDTLALIERMMGDVVGFNLTFDWFHLTKLYNMFRLVSDLGELPINHIETMARLEPVARHGALCLKPQSAVDLMLVARNGIYQNTMDRDPITIRRVPTPLAVPLKDMLEKIVEIPGLYFAKRKKAGNDRWRIDDVTDWAGDYVPEFKDIVLTFAPSTGLKALAADALHADVIHHDDLIVPDIYKVVEDNHVPYGGNWPKIIEHHAYRWKTDALARQYATDDVHYTREIYKFFKCPKPDRDSQLACAVGTIRWSGFAVDLPKLKELKAKAEKDMEGVPRDPGRAKAWIAEAMSETQKLALTGTDKQVLQSIMKWDGEECGRRAGAVLKARQAFYNLTYFDKILRAGRFHVDMKVTGTRTNRMSGDGGLNAQGLTQDPAIRAAFTLADPGEELWGGDFDSFEPSIAATVYYDPGLMAQLKSGKKFHGVFGEVLFPDLSYEEIIASKKQGKDSPYAKAKTASLAFTYMGTIPGIANRINEAEEHMQAAGDNYLSLYPGVRAAQMKIAEDFTCLSQPEGIGSKIHWKDPADYVETILGFRRYFTLENNLIKTLFNLAQDLPKEWRSIKLKVVRRDRQQTAAGATSSALYSAAFSIMSAVIRQAANCKVQSVGGELTKELQLELWGLQPVGIKPFEIKMFNIHDEILSVTRRGPDTAAIVGSFLDRRRKVIELLNMNWARMQSWAG